MKVALSGYGKMGREIHRVASESGVDIVSRIDPAADGATHRQLSSEALANAEVVIDFTTPDVAVHNIRRIAEMKKNAVIGTTGWYDQVAEIRRAVESAGIGLIYASNFSIGVHAFVRMVEAASRLMNRLDDYDACILETHHNQKLDSPSGTARTLAESVLHHLDRKSEAVFDRIDRRIAPTELHVASVRVGSVPGTHSVIFDSAADTITLQHSARSREGFARGALQAAAWVQEKKGFFSLDDYLADLFGSNSARS